MGKICAVSDLLNTTGKRIQRLRKDLDLTQTEVARQMAKRGSKINPSYLSMIEGSDKVPSGEVLRGLAEVLQTTTDYLLLLTEDALRPGELDEEAREVSDQEWELVTALRSLPDPDRLTLFEMTKELIGVLRRQRRRTGRTQLPQRFQSREDLQSWLETASEEDIAAFRSALDNFLNS